MAPARSGEFYPSAPRGEDGDRVVRLLNNCVPRRPILKTPHLLAASNVRCVRPLANTRINAHIDMTKYPVETRMISWTRRAELRNKPPAMCDERRLDRMRSYREEATQEARDSALELIADLEECGVTDKYRKDRAVPGSSVNDDPYHVSDADSCHSDVTVWDSDTMRYERLLSGGGRRPRNVKAN